MKNVRDLERYFSGNVSARDINIYESTKIMNDRNYFGCMMVETGEADAMISGLTKNYPDTIRPAMQVIGTEEGVQKIAGMYLLLHEKRSLIPCRYNG